MQLVKACIDGNMQAQNQLFNQFSRQMMSTCLRYGKDYDEAQEMFQEGFVKVFQKLHMFNGKGPLGAWIRRTIVNNALDYLRKTSRENHNLSLFQVDHKLAAEATEDPFNEEEVLITNDELLQLISKMPTGYRTVFNLYVVEEYTHKEISEMLNISESTSKTQYKKAKSYLRSAIDKAKKKT